MVRKKLLLDHYFVQSKTGFFYKDYSLMNLIHKRKWNKLRYSGNYTSYRRVRHKDFAKIRSVLVAYLIYQEAGPMAVLGLCDKLYLAFRKEINFDSIKFKSKAAKIVAYKYRHKTIKELFKACKKRFESN